MCKYQINDVDVKNTSNEFFVLNDKYRTPNVIDHREFCLPTDNQLDTPHCVGYTIAAYLEIKYWKDNHIPLQFPADKIYQFGRSYKCDSISGTRLEYCLEELKNKEIFNGELLTFSTMIDLKMTIKCFIHKYDCVMGAFNITDEWYKLNRYDIIKEKRNPTQLGGHCVLCCGYNKDGIYVQNSWGYEDWGSYGFGIIPWDMVQKQFQYGVVIDNFSFNYPKVKEILFDGKGG